MIVRHKHSSLFGLAVSNEGKKFYNIDTRTILKFLSSLARNLETVAGNPGTDSPEESFLKPLELPEKVFGVTLEEGDLQAGNCHISFLLLGRHGRDQLTKSFK